VNRTVGRKRITRRNVSIRMRYGGDIFMGFIGVETGLSLQTCF
jgi:hypothetical protein